MNYTKKLAVVVGGTGGLGREISLAFGGQGYSVISIFRSNKVAAKRLDDDFNRLGINGKCFQHDISKGPFELGSWLEGTQAHQDLVLIHAATHSFVPKPLKQWTWTEYESAIGIHLGGGVHCVQSVLRELKDIGKCTFVFVLSSAILDVPRGFAPYLCAKEALYGFAKSVRVELEPFGVRVICIHPGFMRTRLTEGWDPRMQACFEKEGEAEDPKKVANDLLQQVLAG